jgi:hypothetical protein
MRFICVMLACGALHADEATITKPTRFERMPVAEGTKYQLAFRAKQQGAETIEANPRLSELIFNSRTFLPWCRLTFYDAGGKSVGCDSPSWSIPFGEWQDYRWVFYSPAKAAFAAFEIQPGNAKGSSVNLADRRLEPAPDEQSINVNPAFACGPYNYSGWSAFNDVGRLHALTNGATVLDTGFSATSATFPLNEPGTYRWFIRGSSFAPRGGPAFLVFLDESGKEAGRISERIEKPKKERTVYFVLPKGVVRGSFLIYHSVIEELRLTRVGGEEKFKELTQDERRSP